MASIFDLKKDFRFKDLRGKLYQHKWKRYNKRSLSKIKYIVSHHSLTKTGSAQAYAKYHVDTHKWPGIAYHFVIDKDGTINYVNDISLLTYHVGNSNATSVGIVCTGDFRYEDLTAAQRKSLYAVNDILQKILNIGVSGIKGHSEMPDYSWKACPVFDMNVVRKAVGGVGSEAVTIISQSNPEYHTIQEGDTLWGLANNVEGVSVENLKAWNPEIDPSNLKVGQKVRMLPQKTEDNPKGEVSSPKTVGAEPVANGRVIDDVWLHRTPDFEESSRIRMLEKNKVYKVYGEHGALYNVGNAYVSKKYIELIKISTSKIVAPESNLKRGDKGSEVEMLQKALNEVYFRCDIDGSFGPGTEEALRRFQSIYTPRMIDGSYGPATRTALKQELK